MAVAGIDLGSTGIKLLVTDLDGVELAAEQVPTPWRPGPGGTTELDATDLLFCVQELLTRTTEKIEAIAIAGMGETGMLIDATGRAVTPGYAWFDPRGAEQAAAFPPGVRSEFTGRTGLPLGAQVSAAKLAYLRDQGVQLSGLRWLNLPEFVAMALGARAAVEHSLISRTGLIDQDTGRQWPAMLHALGVDETFLPPLLDAGTLWGLAASDATGDTTSAVGGTAEAAGGATGAVSARSWTRGAESWTGGAESAEGGTGKAIAASDAASRIAVPANMAGALITVAGHDHLVAAEAGGGLPPDHYHVSMGTAEVLLRVIDAPLGFEARGRLADHLINEVRHVVPGKHVLVAGVKSGLLLRRALQTAGITDRAGRDVLDTGVMALPFEGAVPVGAIEVSGARNDDGVLKLTVRGDGATPAEVFGAVLRHSNDEIAELIRAMDRELPPAISATLTGGWAGMAAVRRARSRVLPALSVSGREQETAYGATRAAARLLRAASATSATPADHDPTSSDHPTTDRGAIPAHGDTTRDEPTNHTATPARRDTAPDETTTPKKRSATAHRDITPAEATTLARQSAAAHRHTRPTRA
ncbi:FGGY family carbohydrate kinase [Actinoplanes sp. NPDC051470]|uniref:FGGY family carbohydrate kinase n=1 Tax=Actinoplanes sp. NPDC051470 TaxID=3157224 RepID=UPI00342AF336